MDRAWRLWHRRSRWLRVLGFMQRGSTQTRLPLSRYVAHMSCRIHLWFAVVSQVDVEGNPSSSVCQCNLAAARFKLELNRACTKDCDKVSVWHFTFARKHTIDSHFCCLSNVCFFLQGHRASTNEFSSIHLEGKSAFGHGQEKKGRGSVVRVLVSLLT